MLFDTLPPGLTSVTTGTCWCQRTRTLLKKLLHCLWYLILLPQEAHKTPSEGAQAQTTVLLHIISPALLHKHLLFGFTSLYSKQTLFSLNFAAAFFRLKEWCIGLKACLLFPIILVSLVEDTAS